MLTQHDGVRTCAAILRRRQPILAFAPARESIPTSKFSSPCCSAGVDDVARMRVERAYHVQPAVLRRAPLPCTRRWRQRQSGKQSSASERAASTIAGRSSALAWRARATFSRSAMAAPRPIRLAACQVARVHGGRGRRADSWLPGGQELREELRQWAGMAIASVSLLVVGVVVDLRAAAG